jgi:methionyl-tRNA formyltransferase
MGVTCADGIVYIDDIQIAGKKRLNIRELLLGFRSAEEYVFD